MLKMLHKHVLSAEENAQTADIKDKSHKVVINLKKRTKINLQLNKLLIKQIKLAKEINVIIITINSN